MCESSVFPLGFAKTSTPQDLTAHQRQSGMTSQLKSKEALQSSCISDLLYKLSTQAVTSTGLAPEITCKRVFAKRSLTVAEGAVWEVAQKYVRVTQKLLHDM